MNIFTIKITALLLMVVGNILLLFADIMNAANAILNISFILFAFSAAEACLHTRSIKKYILRLAAFAVISEFAYGLVFRQNTEAVPRLTFAFSNVLFTLLAGVVCVMIYKKIASVEREFEIHPGTFVTMRVIDKNPFLLIFTFIPVILLGSIANLLDTDFGGLGIAIIFLLAVYHKKLNRLLTITISTVVLYFTDAFGTIGRVGTFPSFHTESVLMLCVTLLSLLPVWFYNGERGRDGKWWFYAAYPAHLLILSAIILIF